MICGRDFSMLLKVKGVKLDNTRVFESDLTLNRIESKLV